MLKKRKRAIRLKPSSNKGKPTSREEVIINLRAIWHDAANACAHLQGMSSHLKQVLSKSKARALADEMEMNAKGLMAQHRRIHDVLHSKKPYLWKRIAIMLRTYEALRRAYTLKKTMGKLKENPEIKTNSATLKRLDKAEFALATYIGRVKKLLRKNPYFKWRVASLDINAFIKEFLEARGVIRDKAGWVVNVKFEPGAIPAIKINPDDLLRILENLLSDTLTHQERADILIKTYEKRGKVFVEFLSVGGEPIPRSVLRKIGKVPYSITGRPSKGLGKLSVNRIAQAYGGGLLAKNTRNGPLLTVVLSAE